MTWQKGKSGNPKGRPKEGQSWAGMLDDIGREQVKTLDKNGKKISKKEAICRVLYRKAAEGEQWAVNALMDRIDGRPKQQTDIDLTSGGEVITGIERVIVKNVKSKT
jgi:hypothetical protein